MYSLLRVLFVSVRVCLCRAGAVFVPVDQDRAGAVVREAGQKQIQLDKDRTLQAKSRQQTAGSKQEPPGRVCAVFECVIFRLLLITHYDDKYSTYNLTAHTRFLL